MCRGATAATTGSGPGRRAAGTVTGPGPLRYLIIGPAAEPTRRLVLASDARFEVQAGFRLQATSGASVSAEAPVSDSGTVDSSST